MAKRRPVKPANAKTEKPAPKYFVAPTPGTAGKSERAKAQSDEPKPVGAAKYFVRRVVLASELDEVWRGVGPDLPPAYENAEACPDCGAFRFSRHARLCIRNPASPWELALAWNELHAKQQIFFGVGHPVTADVDGYMTVDRQRAIARAGIMILYENGKLAAPFVAVREIIQQWEKTGAGQKING